MLVAVAVWAAYSLLLRRRPSDLPQTLTLVSSIVVALPLLLPSRCSRHQAPRSPGRASVLLGIGYIAIFAR